MDPNSYLLAIAEKLLLEFLFQEFFLTNITHYLFKSFFLTTFFSYHFFSMTFFPMTFFRQDFSKSFKYAGYFIKELGRMTCEKKWKKGQPLL